MVLVKKVSPGHLVFMLCPLHLFIRCLTQWWRRFGGIKRQHSSNNEKRIGHAGLLYMAKDN